MAEGAAHRVLAGEPDGVTLRDQVTRTRALRRCPVDRALDSADLRRSIWRMSLVFGVKCLGKVSSCSLRAAS